MLFMYSMVFALFGKRVTLGINSSKIHVKKYTISKLTEGGKIKC